MERSSKFKKIKNYLAIPKKNSTVVVQVVKIKGLNFV